LEVTGSSAKADIVTLSDDGVLDVGEKRGRQRRQGTRKPFARVLTLWRRPPESFMRPHGLS